MIEFSVRGIGAWGPGFGDWAQLLAGARGGGWQEATALKPERIPPRERRRSPQFVKMAVEVMSQACAAARVEPDDLAVVFATAMSDMQTNDTMCRTLATAPAAVSPTKFHNSVNNAATGYWSIATGSLAPSNALCAFSHSAGMGLLEAATQVEAEGRPVLLVVEDEAAPPPLAHVCPSTTDLALAALLAPAAAEGARWRLTTAPGAAAAATLPGELPDRLAGNPAASLLPFLLASAGAAPRAEIEIPLHADLHLRLAPAVAKGDTR